MHCTLLLQCYSQRKSTYYTKNSRSNIEFQEFSRSFPGFPGEWEPWPVSLPSSACRLPHRWHHSVSGRCHILIVSCAYLLNRCKFLSSYECLTVRVQLSITSKSYVPVVYFQWRVYWDLGHWSLFFREWLHWKCRCSILLSAKGSTKLWAMIFIFSEWFAEI